MNAIIKNKAESELLKLIEEVASLLEIDIDIEIEALQEGGIKDIIRFLKKKKNAPYVIFFATILSGIIINVASDAINKNNELEELNKEEKRLNIKVLKNQLEKDSISKLEQTRIIDTLTSEILGTYKIQIYKSRFYKQIEKERKIYQIATNELDEQNETVREEKTISRQDFKRQILIDEDSKPVTLENINIQIVSPVLSQSNIKWRGIYDGKYIGFHVLDPEFKNDVLNKKYSFTNGTSIKCNIKITYTLSDSGEIIVKEAKIVDVLEVYDGTENHITKKSKQLAELKSQLRLDYPEE